MAVIIIVPLLRLNHRLILPHLLEVAEAQVVAGHPEDFKYLIEKELIFFQFFFY